jgi:hypothetical protein
VAIINGVIFSFFLGSFSQKEVSYGFEILHGVLSQKNIMIPPQKQLGDSSPWGVDFLIFSPDKLASTTF